MKHVAVFCGSSLGIEGAYALAGERTGQAIAERGYGLVYGGASVGLMGTVADACLSSGGKVIGVIPAALQRREIAHTGLTELHVTATMHDRKRLMADRADMFVALPGGIGTLEELFEMWTWTQLGDQAKPIGLLDVNGYYARLIDFLDHSVAQGFLSLPHRAILQVADDADLLMDRLAQWKPVTGSKWDR